MEQDPTLRSGDQLDGQDCWAQGSERKVLADLASDVRSGVADVEVQGGELADALCGGGDGWIDHRGLDVDDGPSRCVHREGPSSAS